MIKHKTKEWYSKFRSRLRVPNPVEMIVMVFVLLVILPFFFDETIRSKLNRSFGAGPVTEAFVSELMQEPDTSVMLQKARDAGLVVESYIYNNDDGERYVIKDSATGAILLTSKVSFSIKFSSLLDQALNSLDLSLRCEYKPGATVNVSPGADFDGLHNKRRNGVKVNRTPGVSDALFNTVSDTLGQAIGSLNSTLDSYSGDTSKVPRFDSPSGSGQGDVVVTFKDIPDGYIAKSDYRRQSNGNEQVIVTVNTAQSAVSQWGALGLKNTLIHELLHGMGLGHVGVQGTNIMNPEGSRSIPLPLTNVQIEALVSINDNTKDTVLSKCKTGIGLFFEVSEIESGIYTKFKDGGPASKWTTNLDVSPPVSYLTDIARVLVCYDRSHLRPGAVVTDIVRIIGKDETGFASAFNGTFYEPPRRSVFDDPEILQKMQITGPLVNQQLYPFYLKYCPQTEPFNPSSPDSYFPKVNNVSVNQVGSSENQYQVVADVLDPNGADKIKYVSATINREGSNAEQYRGNLVWTAYNFPVDPKDLMSCSGGFAGINPNGYGSSYITLDSCSVTSSGNSKIVTFGISLDTSFTSPTTNIVSVSAGNDLGSLGYKSNFSNASFNLPTPPPTPTITFTATPASIVSGQNSTLNWASTDTTSCVASSSWSGTKATGGTELVSPTATSSYTIVCVGAGGSETKSVTVSVQLLQQIDVTPPTANITYPPDNKVYSGWLSYPYIQFTAVGSDETAVSKLEYYIDGVLKHTQPIGFHCTQGCANTSPPLGPLTTLGVHTLQSKTYDSAGNVASSSIINISVIDNVSPKVSITSPPSGTTLSGQVNLTANASDNDGILGVQFYVGNPSTPTLMSQSIGKEDLVAPYSALWDTTMTTGSKVLYAVSRDKSGNSGYSLVVPVTISNPDTTPPTISITTPTSSSVSSGSSVAISATATDNVGVVGVQFKVDGVNLGTEDTSSPYSATWNTSGFANGSHSITTVARDIAGNTTTSTVVTVTIVPSTITIGNTSVLSTSDNNRSNRLLAQKVTLGQTATVKSLSIYVATAAGKLRLGVYDATGPSGGPGKKKAETLEFTPVSGWNTVTVTTPVSLTAGNYWLAFLPNSNSLTIRKTSTGSAKSYSYTYGTLPSTFSTFPNSLTNTWSFYATLQP